VAGAPGPASGPWWGWHQLDARWARRLVTEAVCESGIGRGALVVDIGAGTGALTRPLVEAGARVIAVEAHPGRAAELRARFGGAVVVVQVDAGDLRLPRRPYHVVANPPFGLTTALLRRLLQPGSRLQSARLVLQPGSAARWAGPSAPGRRRWERDFDVTLGARLPAAAFHPRPPVGARVLVVDRR